MTAASCASSTGLLARGYTNDGWACKHKCPVDHPNRDICDELAKVMRCRYLAGAERRELSYANAIAILAGYPRRIASHDEAMALKGIGPSIAALISEFLSKGRIGVLEALLSDPKYAVLDQLCGIYGVGPKTAQRWYRAGVRSVRDVEERSKELRLTKQQQLGLQYHHDMQHEMTRAEAEQVHAMIRSVLPASADLHLSGSYRRGKATCSDVDVLVCCEQDMGVLERIVSALGGQVRAILLVTKPLLPGQARSARPAGRLGSYLVLLEVPGQEHVRRVDIVHVPSRTLLPWAQLAWTGSRHFERSIRMYAERQLDITLSSCGALCNQSKTYLHAQTEEECFKVLQLDFIEPRFRNC